jgi:ABC-type Mn2+/Zn2+ transport system permease subunit
VHGIRIERIELLFSLLTAAVVVASVRVLGVLLIAAAVVIPAAVARLVTRSFGTMLALSTLLGVVSSVIGLYVSFHVDVPSGPTIVVTGALVFAVVFAVTAGTARLALGGARRRARDADPGVELTREPAPVTLDANGSQ